MWYKLFALLRCEELSSVLCTAQGSRRWTGSRMRVHNGGAVHARHTLYFLRSFAVFFSLFHSSFMTDYLLFLHSFLLSAPLTSSFFPPLFDPRNCISQERYPFVHLICAIHSVCMYLLTGETCIKVRMSAT